MELYIAIDSGGTKTEGILADENGHILHRTTCSGCNPLDIGADTARNLILSCVEELEATARGPVASIYAGIAGVNHVDLGLEALIEEKYPNTKVRIEDDRRIVLSGTLGHVDGCGMICGTGSSLSIIQEGQPIRQVGGLGYLIDTCGSGYELGQAGLKAAFRYLDGRSGYTMLAEKITQFIHKNPWDSLAEIYAGGRPYIASLAHLVFEAAYQGDAVSQNILEQAAGELAELTYAAGKYFTGEFPVVMTGGIFSAYPDYAEKVRQKSCKQARMIMATVPPVYGALVEAMWQNGLIADDTVKENFLSDSQRLRKVS